MFLDLHFRNVFKFKAEHSKYISEIYFQLPARYCSRRRESSFRPENGNIFGEYISRPSRLTWLLTTARVASLATARLAILAVVRAISWRDVLKIYFPNIFQIPAGDGCGRRHSHFPPDSEIFIWNIFPDGACSTRRQLCRSGHCQNGKSGCGVGHAPHRGENCSSDRGVGHALHHRQNCSSHRRVGGMSGRRRACHPPPETFPKKYFEKYFWTWPSRAMSRSF